MASSFNSTRRSNWLSPYPSTPSAPRPIYQPKDNRYLVQAVRATGAATMAGLLRHQQLPADFPIDAQYRGGIGRSGGGGPRSLPAAASHRSSQSTGVSGEIAMCRFAWLRKRASVLRSWR
jgi:hypothetical protein